MSNNDTTHLPQTKARLLVNQHGLISGVRFTSITPDVVFGEPEVVRIKPSGEVVMAEGANLDDAARAFWNAITEWRGDGSRPTLADAQPGGRVRLGDQAELEKFEAWAVSRAWSIQRWADGLRRYSSCDTEKMWEAWQAAVSAQPSPGGQDALASLPLYRLADDANGNRGLHRDDTGSWVKVQDVERALAARQPVGEPVSDECEGCNGGIRYDAQGCSCMTCGKRPKWYMAGRRIRVTERRKPWKHLGAPVPFEAECTWQMGDSIDYRLDGETTSRRLNNFHQHWEKVEVIR